MANVNLTAGWSSMLPASAVTQPSNDLVAVTLLSAFIAYSLYHLWTPKAKTKSNEIYRLPAFSLFTAWKFFGKRHDFVWSTIRKGHQFFQFRVLKYNVFAVSGEEARKVFFSNPHLSFTEGYRILLASDPRIQNTKDNENILTSSDQTTFNKFALRLNSKDRLQSILPAFFSDINDRMDQLGKIGKIDPFEHVRLLVVQMTVRMATCESLANDTKTVNRFSHLLEAIQRSGTPITMIFPWFPSMAMISKIKISTEYFRMLLKIVEARREAATLTSDLIDIFISEGYDSQAIIEMVSGIMFAGVSNTTVAACWSLIYLGAYPEWKEKARQEALDFVNKHLGPHTPGIRLHERLGSIPVQAWDDEVPVFDAILQETMRMNSLSTFIRRNGSEDIRIGDKVIDKGAFMVYDLTDVHLNDAVYPDPEKWDPSRWTEKDGKPNVAYPFLGWGVGRHPCLGIRAGKVQAKVVLTLFLLAYEYKLVDGSGKFPSRLPKSDPDNAVHGHPKAGNPCYLEFKRVVD